MGVMTPLSVADRAHLSNTCALLPNPNSCQPLFILSTMCNNMSQNSSITCTLKWYLVVYSVAEIDRSVCSAPGGRAGICKGSFQSWYFNQEQGTCEPFIFGGCEAGSSPNKFKSKELCHQTCNGADQIIELYWPKRPIFTDISYVFILTS